MNNVSKFIEIKKLIRGLKVRTFNPLINYLHRLWDTPEQINK